MHIAPFSRFCIRKPAKPSTQADSNSRLDTIGEQCQHTSHNVLDKPYAHTKGVGKLAFIR